MGTTATACRHRQNEPATIAPVPPQPPRRAGTDAIHLTPCPKIVSQAPAERPRVPTITVGLRPHPSTAARAAGPAQAADQADAPAPALLATMYATPDGGAGFEFALEGLPAAELRIPAPAAPGPGEDLWRHTCFEVFLALAGEPGYREYNFAPSGQWAIYDFRAERERADARLPAAAPTIRFDRRDDRLSLVAQLPAAALPAVPPGTELQAGLSAVLERSDGRLEYWAVHHPGATPDFHARAGFVLMFKTWQPPVD